MIKKIFAFIVLTTFLGAGFIYYKVNETYDGPQKIVHIKSGSSFPQINQKLYSEGVIKDRRIFHYLAKFKNKMTKLRSGAFQIPSGSTYEEILNLLSSANSLSTKVTIPEGKNLFEIAAILFHLKVIANKEEFIKELKNLAIVQEYKLDGQTLEGYLFPDTYFFPLGVSEKDIIKMFISNFKEKTAHFNFQNSNLSFYELLTLASVVEKETGASFERAKIAGVFFNRLKKKMKLQSDPTIIYGIFEKYDGNIRRKDIHTHHAYNTYTIKALPIGPIANPGTKAIEAVLSPEKHDYLYFVSKNNGTHVFTKNYKDHLKAVQKWQLTKKNKQGRSWRDLKEKSK